MKTWIGSGYRLIVYLLEVASFIGAIALTANERNEKFLAFIVSVAAAIALMVILEASVLVVRAAEEYLSEKEKSEKTKNE